MVNISFEIIWNLNVDNIILIDLKTITIPLMDTIISDCHIEYKMAINFINNQNQWQSKRFSQKNTR
jgi:hypothetical protein